MKLTKTQIRAMLLKYDSKNVARNLLKKVSESSPYEIGRAILSTKMSRQNVINLRVKQ